MWDTDMLLVNDIDKLVPRQHWYRVPAFEVEGYIYDRYVPYLLVHPSDLRVVA